MAFQKDVSLQRFACHCKNFKQRLLDLEPKSSTLDNSATLYHRTSITIFALQNKTLKQSKWRMNHFSWNYTFCLKRLRPCLSFDQFQKLTQLISIMWPVGLSRGMILALGARGLGFKSRTSPQFYEWSCVQACRLHVMCLTMQRDSNWNALK